MTPRETITAGPRVTAFAVRQQDGTINVHVLRQGLPSLTIQGVELQERGEDRAETEPEMETDE